MAQESAPQELSNEQKLKISIDNIKNKKNKVMFFVPDLGKVPSGAVYEIYSHATLVKSLGYDVKVLLETAKSTKPEYVEPELLNLEHITMESAKLTVSPEDLLVIPEIFTNVMEQAKSLPCGRVVLFQSLDNATRALLPGTDWSNFGIKDVITTSNIMQLFIEEFFGKNKFNVRTYNVPVPDYFQKTTELKRPVVSVFVRNEGDLEKVIKLFYSKYPQYRWITFEPMQTDSKPPQYLRRRDFADKLGKNFAAIWIDRLATHAQFPLECMRVGTIPIALKPDVTPEYIIKDDKFVENSGVWTSDLYAMPSLLADTLRRFLDDEVPQELWDTMDSIAANYTTEIAKKQLTKIYRDLIGEKLLLLEKTLEAITPKAAEPSGADEVKPLTDQLLS